MTFEKDLLLRHPRGVRSIAKPNSPLNRIGVEIGKSRPALSGAGARAGQKDDRDAHYKNRGREENP